MMASVYDIDVDDWVQTLDKQWHQILGVKFHTRKGIKVHPCIGKHEKPKGLIRDWSVTTKDGLVLGMRDINRYASQKEMMNDEELRKVLENSRPTRYVRNFKVDTTGSKKINTTGNVSMYEQYYDEYEN